MIGAGVGECLIARTDLRWVIATDEHGTDLALHRPRNDVLRYPANLVGKCWCHRTFGIIPGLIVALVESVAVLSPSEPPTSG